MTLSASVNVNFNLNNNMDIRSLGYDDLYTASESIIKYPMSWSFTDTALDMASWCGTLTAGTSVSYNLRTVYNSFDSSTSWKLNPVHYFLLQNASTSANSIYLKQGTIFPWSYVPTSIEVRKGSIFMLVDDVGFATSGTSCNIKLDNTGAGSVNYKLFIIGNRTT